MGDISTLVINDKPDILDQWKSELDKYNFSVDAEGDIHSVMGKLRSKRYELVVVDIGECSFGQRQYALVDWIKDLKPGVVLVGVSGCCQIEDSQHFDATMYHSQRNAENLMRNLVPYGFEVIQKSA